MVKYVKLNILLLPLEHGDLFILWQNSKLWTQKQLYSLFAILLGKVVSFKRATYILAREVLPMKAINM